ncbi:E3 ubiquitin-protein ligase RAD18 isoform X3 [Corythoichthys intestinalis]|uniref:E3 ubiquitin-protein ligase RAD18 isoform X3 n=1 Tax=Corythoichthys intestinalis TaxID=161448 RepID=UPI0025A5337A|nr:E3 ubiquitin-protein ligase RAD18 isoform X3 [Corythoichthys intestinalis]
MAAFQTTRVSHLSKTMMKAKTILTAQLFTISVHSKWRFNPQCTAAFDSVTSPDKDRFQELRRSGSRQMTLLFFSLSAGRGVFWKHPVPKSLPTTRQLFTLLSFQYYSSMAFQAEADISPALTHVKEIDALLRCPICFDFLNITMMTTCSHNFCSLCIRKFFSYKLQCPVCNAKATEQDLRNNRLLDDLVVNFRAARQQLSETHFGAPPMSPKHPASVKTKEPRYKDQMCKNSVVSQFFQKRPSQSAKADHTGRTGNSNDMDLHSITVKKEAMDVGEVSPEDAVSVKLEVTELHSISEELPHTSSSPPTDTKPVIKVECPVCSVCVSPMFINKHLDMCLTSEEKKESLRSSFGKTRHPMGKLVYHLLSLQELKRRLKECNLSVQGSRDQLIKRHKEFVHIYNAQCDSLNPKPADEIVKEVEANEKIKNQLKDEVKPVMVFSKNHSEEEIDEVHSTYRKQHSSDFSRLVAQVRGRLDTTKKTRIKQEVAAGGEQAEQTPSAAQVTESRNSLDIKPESEEETGPSTRGIVLSNSPTYSDVSISSVTERTSVKKQTSCSRRTRAHSSTALGKRRRKT